MSHPSPNPKPTDDGRERFGRNVAFAWGGYMVNVVSGFIVPRMISDHLGQTTLGIWDFAWSFIAYFGLVQLGMGSSISRYVAHHRAVGDVAGLNRSVSTIAVFQRSAGGLAAVMAIACVVWIMPLFASRFGSELSTASWVVFFLGMEVALTTSLAVYGAVIVGCHRWDITNSVNAIAYVASTVSMIAVLLLGGGLPALALVHCLCMVGGELARCQLSKRVCPELGISFDLASWPTFLEQARYSAKTMIPSIADLFSNQAMSLLIVGFLGPASLAIFSRSRSLMTTLRTLSVKFGMIVVPTASALQAKNDHMALQETLLSKPAIISCVALPILISMAVLGGHLMTIWMGGNYVLPGLLPILAIGTYATLVQEPVWSLFSGMNRHGRIAIYKLVAGVISAALLLVGMRVFHWGVLGAAACFVLPRLVVDGAVVPWFACDCLGVSKMEFIWKAYVRPLLCVAPFGVALWHAEVTAPHHPVAAVLTFAGGVVLTAAAYHRWLVPETLRKRINFFAAGLLPRHGAKSP